MLVKVVHEFTDVDRQLTMTTRAGSALASATERNKRNVIGWLNNKLMMITYSVLLAVFLLVILLNSHEEKYFSGKVLSFG